MNKQSTIAKGETVEAVLDKLDAERETKMRIWNAVCRTDPRHTKKVNQRGGFTAIDAQYQIQRATEMFGPVGEGWGYEVGEYNIVGSLIIVPVTLWHSGDRDKTFGPILGCSEIQNGNRADRDAPKKAITDAITKGLSQLGFNADVFLGLYDDNKYVAEVTAEFTPKTDEEPARPRERLEGPYPSPTALKGAIKAFVTALSQMDDFAAFNAWMETEEVVELEKQARRYLPDWWEEGIPDKPEFVPVAVRIHQKKRDLEQIDELKTRQEA